MYPQENIYILPLFYFTQSCNACDCDEIFELNEAIILRRVFSIQVMVAINNIKTTEHSPFFILVHRSGVTYDDTRD